MAEAPTKKTWDGLILGIAILVAIAVVAAFAYLFPHCQIASNRDPSFASKSDPLTAMDLGLST